MNWWPWASSMGPSIAPPCPCRPEDRPPWPHAPRVIQATPELLYRWMKVMPQLEIAKKLKAFLSPLRNKIYRLTSSFNLNFCPQHSRCISIILKGKCWNIKCLIHYLSPLFRILHCTFKLLILTYHCKRKIIQEFSGIHQSFLINLNIQFNFKKTKKHEFFWLFLINSIN